MINFLPYISQKEKEKTQQLAKIIKKKEGTQAYLQFQKLIVLGMYGITIEGKISFESFLYQLKKHVIEKEKSIFTFWDMYHPKYNLHGDRLRAHFLLPIEVFNQATLLTLPTEMRKNITEKLMINRITLKKFNPYKKYHNLVTITT